MSTLRARYDGKTFVPVDPVEMPVGTQVKVVVEGQPEASIGTVKRRQAGMAKGAVLWMSPDFADPVDDFEDKP